MPINNSLRLQRILARDGMRCHVCGLLMIWDEQDRSLQAAASIDHLLPAGHVSRGLMLHLRAAHRGCNSLREHALDVDIRRACREYMIRRFRDELLRAGETPYSLTLALLEVSPEARQLWLDRYKRLPKELRLFARAS